MTRRTRPKARPKQVAAKLPPHVIRNVRTIIEALREDCDDDEELLWLVMMDEDDDPRFKKVSRAAGGEVERSLGYLLAIEQSFKVSARALLHLAPP